MNDFELNFGGGSDNSENQMRSASNKGKKSKEKKETSTPGESVMDFEASLRRLEEIVSEMEDGKLSLEESMKRFEEGSKLANFCNSKLIETEQRVEILLNKEKGEWQPFSDDPSDNTSK